MNRLAALVVIVCGLTTPLLAQEAATPEATIETLLTEPVRAEQFSDAFLASVPFGQIEALLGQISQTIGAPDSIAAKGAVYEVTTQTYSMDVRITLDGEGRVSSLVLGGPVSLTASVPEMAAMFEQLPGEVSYLVMRDGEVLAQKDADTPMAVGSTFKLGILSLLKDQIAANETQWDAVIPVGQHSLPTGVLQTLPEGSPVTIHTAAATMISLSDNTATDMLLDLVGRAALAEKLETDFVLKTREFFFLKGDEEAREAFLAADAAGKMALVETLAGREMPALSPIMPVHQEGIEWYLTAEQICTLLGEVGELDVMSINPGVANPAEWARVAFKGGSETGVLNLSSLLTDEEGRVHCVVASVNADAAVDENQVSSVYAGVIKVLGRG